MFCRAFARASWVVGRIALGAGSTIEAGIVLTGALRTSGAFPLVPTHTNATTPEVAGDIHSVAAAIVLNSTLAEAARILLVARRAGATVRRHVVVACALAAIRQGPLVSARAFAVGSCTTELNGVVEAIRRIATGSANRVIRKARSASPTILCAINVGWTESTVAAVPLVSTNTSAPAGVVSQYRLRIVGAVVCIGALLNTRWVPFAI